MADQVVGRYEMLWDCEYCGTAGLLGLTHRHCPECGATQDAERRYFPNEDQKVAVEDHPYAGSDKVCASCGAAAGAKTVHCGNCGAPMDEGGNVRRRAEQVEGNSGGFSADSVDQAKHERAAAGGAPRLASASASAAPGRSRKWWIIGGAVAAVIVLLIVIASWRKSAQISVAAVKWKRSIAIETLANVRESAWRDRLPTNAIAPTCREEKRSTRRVEDGQTCKKKRRDKGDGTFEEVETCSPTFRNEPVYDQKCSYMVTKWQQSRTVDSEGSGHTPEPTWPTVQLARTGSAVGAEREGKRSEHYFVELTDQQGESHQCEFADKARWTAFQPGSKWSGEVRMIGGGLACDTLKPAK